MRAFRCVGWCVLGVAPLGCAELLGANFDDLEPRPPPDASPQNEAPPEDGQGMDVGGVSDAERSRTSARDRASPRAAGGSIGVPPRATGEPHAPRLGSVDEPGSDAPPEAPRITEDVEMDGGASAPAAPVETARRDAGSKTPALSSVTDAAAPDAASEAPPAPRCAASSPFSRIEPVLGVPVNASRIRLSADELTAHFSSLVESRWLDLFTSRRTDRDRPFSVPEALAPLNGSGAETSPVFAPDGTALYFESSRTGFFRIFEARRGEAGGWEVLGTVPNIAAVGFGDGGPFIAPQSGDLYFHSDRLGAGDLFRAARGPAGFEVPIPLQGVNTEGAESFPLVSADERTLYFVRTAAGPGGSHSDIWMATRGSEMEPFGAAREVPELNTELTELPDWISPDGCRLYFSRMPVVLWLGSVVHVAIREPVDAGAGN